MRARLRHFLLMLLMLALPLQAVASSALLGCMAAHAAAPDLAAAAHLSMAHDDMADCHESAPAHPPASHDCKHCAACVLGSALPMPAMAGVPALAVGASYPAHAAVAFSGFVPDGPERPPRPPLA